MTKNRAYYSIMQFKFLLSHKCNINIAYNAGRFVDVITY